jgi:peptidoglycan/xylan/chitin deacetylase (PgdA/CDA1 family)
MKNLLLLSLIFGTALTTSIAQSYEEDSNPVVKSEFLWPDGKKMGLSLTFDDARFSQVEKGIPLLDKYNIKATFYVSPDAMIQRIDDWKKAVKNGHEIGNHSIVHPCWGNFDWARDTPIENYTLQSMHAELDSANKIIGNSLGITPSSYAYPCGHTFIGKAKETKSLVPLISSMFETGRTWLAEVPNDPVYCDMAQLSGMEMDGKSFEQIKDLIDNAKETGSWLVCPQGY